MILRLNFWSSKNGMDSPTSHLIKFLTIIRYKQAAENFELGLQRYELVFNTIFSTETNQLCRSAQPVAWLKRRYEEFQGTPPLLLSFSHPSLSLCSFSCHLYSTLVEG